MELEKAKAPIDDGGVQSGGLAMSTDIAGNAASEQGENASSARQRPGKAYCAFKRCFDFIMALIASMVLILPLLLLMVLVMIRDPGNPLFFQKRVGKDGRLINIAKLRTMRKNSDQLEKMLTPKQLEEYRHEYKLRDDPRLIGWKRQGDGRKCFGGILRRFSLDELPQIPLNICLTGNMSLVGPRPILKEELEKYYTPEEQRELLSVKPGVTGYWQAYARNDASYETGERQRMELYYVRNRSLKLDIRILLHTIVAVLSTRGGVLNRGISKRWNNPRRRCSRLTALAEWGFLGSWPMESWWSA